jgi:hypothetical protein
MNRLDSYQQQIANTGKQVGMLNADVAGATGMAYLSL